MPQYFIAFNDEWVPKHTPEQLQDKARRVESVIDTMRDAGVFMYGNGALDASTCIGSVVAQGARPVFSDGPYVETKEHLGGFCVIEAPDDDAAREWAGRLAVALDWPQEIHRFPDAPNAGA